METRRPGGVTPSFMALSAAFFIQRSAVGRHALISRPPCPTSPNSSALGERGPQLRVYRYDPRLTALPLADVEAGEVASERQVAGLQGQRLRDPQAGTPLDEKQEPCPRVRRCPYQGLYLVGPQVLRQLLGGPPAADGVPQFGMLSPGSSVARVDGLFTAVMKGLWSGETLSPSDCPNLGRGLQV